MGRIILHSDMNNFYASVECMLNPSLKGKPLAVCGSLSDRHGIVLAKNYAAKAYGIQTGEVVWKAQQKGRDLVIVPPQYDQYIRMSRKARAIYNRYTDRIEPFGMDECWLDLTGCYNHFSSGEEIAYDIKETIKSELGLTVSIGVSFNKIFAKFGSDMKKPDAVTCITEENFREKIWNMPAGDMLGVGYASERCLLKYGIHTIGELANTDPQFLKAVLKSHGLTLWQFANGLDNSKVCEYGYKAPIKSIGHGITTKRDLKDDRDVWPVTLELAQDIGHKLRENDLAATGVAIYVRNSDLSGKGWQMKIPMSTQSDLYIAKQCFALFKREYQWHNNIRSITIRAIDLIPSNQPVQVDFFNDRKKLDSMERLDEVKDKIRQRFGENSIMNAVLLNKDKMLAPESAKGIKMPSGLLTLR